MRTGSEQQLQPQLIDAGWAGRRHDAEIACAAMFVDTPSNCVWLNTLNDSSRNCSRTPPVSAKFLNSARSRLFTPGPRSVFRPRVAERAGRRLREGGGVEPAVDAPLAGVRIADQIGAVGAERVVEAAEIGGGDREREAVLPGVDAVDLPAADHRVLHAGRVAGELLAAAEWQVVDEAADQPMVDIEVRQAVVALRDRGCRGSPASR